jgi:hypothetical protein
MVYMSYQYNEFYGLSFEGLKETIGEEKYEYYEFETETYKWTQDDWDRYQEFITYLYPT